MKLVSLNVEGRHHLDKVVGFLKKEDPDLICLQEAPIDISSMLKKEGYRVTFLPLILMPASNGLPFPKGNLMAFKGSSNIDIYHYYKPSEGIAVFDPERKRETMSQAVIFANTKGVSVATTHFTWAPKGEVASKEQVEDMKSMFEFLDKKPPHILCGDLNITRNINRLYREELVPRYTDAIPAEYESSLDRRLHRSGGDPELSKLFDRFMVDHLLLKEPFKAKNVRLEFGVSDHAAVVADIE
ncbi:MAG: endonuclease/exonuclease/phosphatase family protein [Patescibacteria group bacterium]